MKTDLEITIQLTRDEGTNFMVLLLLLDLKRDQMNDEQMLLLDRLQAFLRGSIS
jgi:hypothetical protein